MTEYICSFTNQATNNPVVSTKSGHIFDKEAIETHLSENSVCPITNKPLTQADLIPLNGIKSFFTHQGSIFSG